MRQTRLCCPDRTVHQTRTQAVQGDESHVAVCHRQYILGVQHTHSILDLNALPTGSQSPLMLLAATFRAPDVRRDAAGDLFDLTRECCSAGPVLGHQQLDGAAGHGGMGGRAAAGPHQSHVRSCHSCIACCLQSLICPSAKTQPEPQLSNPSSPATPFQHALRGHGRLSPFLTLCTVACVVPCCSTPSYNTTRSPVRRARVLGPTP